MAQINMRIDEEQKERWERKAEESPEVSNLSQYIRRAVEREIADEHDPDDVTVVSNPEIANEILERLEGVEETVNHVGNTVSTLANESGGPANDRHTRAEIYGALPRGEENAASLEEIADSLADPFHVDVVAVNLRPMVDDGQVETVVTDGTTHYYKE